MNEERKQQEIENVIDLEKDIETDYPFRPSLTDKTKARCGYCKFEEEYFFGCQKGHELQYPLMVTSHNCPDYEFQPDKIPVIPNDMIKLGSFGNFEKFPECDECIYHFKNRCEGIRWYPIKQKDGKCEFFNHKNNLCKYAVPYLQYGNHFRNNHCRLPPEQRDPNSNQKYHWEYNCGVNLMKRLSCYRPIKELNNE